MKKNKTQTNIQIKSLQNLFNPKTLHKKYYTNPYNKNQKSKIPLKKQNLPPSFFLKPSKPKQKNNLIKSLTSTLPNNFLHSFHHTPKLNTLSSNTLNSILKNHNFQKLLNIKQ